jgi:outer membrane protein
LKNKFIMNKIKYKPAVYLLFIILIITAPFKCYQALAADENQLNTDTLTLVSAVMEVVASHPMVQEAKEALNAADSKIGIAKSGYLPTLNFSASYVYLYPDPAIPFGGMNFQLYPENNWDLALNLNVNIYDFGRTSNRVKLEQEGKNITEHSMESVKQQLTFKTVSTYYLLLYLEEALTIKDQEIKILKDHYDFVKKRAETGSATDYEVLSTQVRLSYIESQKLDLKASWETQSSVLNLLLGKPEKTVNKLSNVININPILENQDSVISEALQNRSDMLMALENEKLADTRIQIAQKEYNPSLHAFASGGYKNGYPDFVNPDAINNLEKNLSAGIGLSMPLYNASRTKNSVSIAKSGYLTSQFETENLRRKIVGEVVDYYQKVDASLKKIDQYRLQLEQAQKSFNLAQVSFSAGVITNLDLLDATNVLAQSQLDLLRSKIEYIVSLDNLKIATGIRLYE